MLEFIPANSSASVVQELKEIPPARKRNRPNFKFVDFIFLLFIYVDFATMVTRQHEPKMKKHFFVDLNNKF